MAKNAVLKKPELEDDFDFSDIVDSSYEDEVMGEMMAALVESNHHQMNIALELTKLIVEKNAAAAMSEDSILETFIRASKTISENSPLKVLFDKMK